MRFRLRKDRLVSEDNISYIAFGVNIYKGWKRVRSIKDISLNKKRVRCFVRCCNRRRVELQQVDNVVQTFVEDESNVIKKPCF